MFPWLKMVAMAAAVSPPGAGVAPGTGEAASGAGVLGGPAVVGGAARATLVAYDMQNRLRELDASPEREALRLLGLPEAALERAEAVFAARALRVDAFVAGNLLTLGELDTAGKAGLKLDAAILLAKLVERGWGLVTEPPMREQVAAALDDDPRSRFRSLVNEYRRAWRRQAEADARAKGDQAPAWALALAEHATALGLEVGRSFERLSASGMLFTDYLLAGVELSERQRALFHDMKLEMLTRTGARPSEKDQQALILGIAAHLNEAQREAVIRKVPR